MTSIDIQNLSKRYFIKHVDLVHGSLKEQITNFVKYGYEWLTLKKDRKKNLSTEQTEEFWALRNLNLKIEAGDRVAILGRNGAGKSTLLRILSRITEPTEGFIKINGRVSSLLEAGTGFHPELTGRENIVLNGIIMGMSYREIKKKFDEIVFFADIEKFLDTPIKKYSSGMFMRLGFSIAAHLDSEIMIVDEVLAVGDAKFQEKCLKKMNEIGTQNRTILFVSHSVNAVLSLCNKGLFLEGGKIKSYDEIERCVNQYVNSCPVATLSWKGNVGDEEIRLYGASLNRTDLKKSFFYLGEKTSLDVEVEILKPYPELIFGFTVLNSRNHIVAHSRLCDSEYRTVFKERGKHFLSCEIDLGLFHPGEYQLQVECVNWKTKKVVFDQVMIKLPVYAPDDEDLRPEAGIEVGGISLGNRWSAS